MNLNSKDYDEIVALYIDDEIYFDQAAIDKTKEKGYVDGFIRREIFKFMAEFDLSPKWKEYANYPTLFTETQFNEYCKSESKCLDAKMP